MGKALDCDFAPNANETTQDDRNRCDQFRRLLVDRCNFQIGWAVSNRKSLEPSRIAPTWIHMDIRQYDKRYLSDSFFVTTAEKLDSF